MNDEIKEILDKLKEGDWYNELDLTGEMWIELRWEETHLLLNYITNLQQENEIRQQDINNLTYQLAKMKEENERLKDSRDWWQDRFFGQQEYDDSHRITAIEYKKRIDKAIELLDKISKLKQYEDDYKISSLGLQEVKDILQNGSDEE